MTDYAMHLMALGGMVVGFLMARLLNWGWGDFAIVLATILLLDYAAPRIISLSRGEIQGVRGFLRGA